MYGILELQRKIALGRDVARRPVGEAARRNGPLERRRGRRLSRRAAREDPRALSRLARSRSASRSVDLDLPTIEVAPDGLARRSRASSATTRSAATTSSWICAGVDNLKRRGRPTPLRGRRPPALAVARRARARARSSCPTARRRRSRRVARSGRPPTGSSARPSTSSASTFRGTRTCAGSSATTPSSATPLRKDYAPGPALVLRGGRPPDARLGAATPRSGPGTSRRRRSRSARRTPRRTGSST